MSDEAPLSAPRETLDPDQRERWQGEPEKAILEYRDADSFEVEAQGHRLTFFPAGVDRLAALTQHINSARESLAVMFYLFQADEAGTLVRDALVDAARRGIRVHLIVDAFGSDAPLSFFDPLVEAGGKVDRFEPRWGKRYLIRNHQKFVIADDARVMTGGFNVSDHYFKPPEENGWCDLGVLIEGEVVGKFAQWFEQLTVWVAGGHTRFREIRRMLRQWDSGEGPVQLVLGGPTRVTSNWAKRVMRDLFQGERVDLVMAYFSPPGSIRRMIQRLARRGGARLVMAGKSDNGATIGASRALYSRLLGSGAQVLEFQPCKLHMKLLVIDDITYVGSANMDMRSTRLNLELMVRIEDADLAARMRQLVDHLAKHSTQIDRAWAKEHATLCNRARWRVSNWLVSVVDYTVTRQLNLGQ
jgi:cardiolipin synthase